MIRYHNTLEYLIIMSYIFHSSETYSYINLKTALGYEGQHVKIRKKGITNELAKTSYVQLYITPGHFDKKKRLNNNSCEIFENPRRQRSVEVYSVRCISSITSTYVTVQIMNNGTLVKADEFKQLSDTRKTIR